MILCPCDNPFKSNFVRYFIRNFNRLGLKKLIATCYVPVRQLTLWDFLDDTPSEVINERPYKATITKVDSEDINHLLTLPENELTTLKGDGDFRSKECQRILDEADIVVTNPPFSLFSDFFNLIVSKRKGLVLLGNINALTRPRVFQSLKEGSVWMGQSIIAGDIMFNVPSDYPQYAHGFGVDEGENRYIRVTGICWYASVGKKQYHSPLKLTRRYEKEEYPKYDNYDAIEVNFVSDIPYDYEGIMGVPITFLYKYNPEQFEIIGASLSDVDGGVFEYNTSFVNPIINGKNIYKRVFIKNRYPML